MAEASERLRWVVDTMAVSPDEHLLEAGCGHGVAVSLICERLVTGSITAIDRSPRMIEAAARRNQRCVACGKAQLISANFHEASLPREHYDRIFAVHVASFWMKPARDLQRARELLAPGGRLQLFGHGPDARGTEAFAHDVPPVLQLHGWRTEVTMGEISAGLIVCISAVPI